MTGVVPGVGATGPPPVEAALGWKGWVTVPGGQGGRPD